MMKTLKATLKIAGICLVTAQASPLEIHNSPDNKISVTYSAVNWLHAADWNLQDEGMLKEYDRAISVVYQNHAVWTGVTTEGKTQAVWSEDSNFGVLLDEPKSSPSLFGISISNRQCEVSPISINALLKIGAAKLPFGGGSLPHDDIQDLSLKNGQIEGVYVRSKFPSRLAIHFRVLSPDSQNGFAKVEVLSIGKLLDWSNNIVH